MIVSRIEAEFEYQTDGRPLPRLALHVSDTGDQSERLVFEGAALRELARIFQGIEERWPGLLDGPDDR
jgi:hypothetical protein